MNKQLQRHKLSSNGFTLLEVMIALVVLSIGILSLGGMQITAIRGNSSANSITEAANEARDQIETLIGKEFDDIDFDIGNHNVGTTKIWTVSDWSSDGISNDGDTAIDEFDERGVKSIQLTIQYPNNGKTVTSTIHFLKTEIF